MFFRENKDNHTDNVYPKGKTSFEKANTVKTIILLSGGKKIIAKISNSETTETAKKKTLRWLIKWSR